LFLYKQKNLKENVEIRDSLRVIFGMGKYKSFLICVKAGFSYPFPVSNLNFYNFFFCHVFWIIILDWKLE